MVTTLAVFAGLSLGLNIVLGIIALDLWMCLKTG